MADATRAGCFSSNILYIGIAPDLATIKKKWGVTEKKVPFVFRVSKISNIFALDFPNSR